MHNGTIIGFDFGTKRIGIAVGQTITRTATPLAVVTTKNGKPDFTEIDTLMKHWRPVALVVGHPLNMDGTTQPLTDLVADFARTLETRYQLPVYLMDERLSTIEAREKVFAAGGYRALTKKPVDGIAAQIILENWLRTTTIITN